MHRAELEEGNPGLGWEKAENDFGTKIMKVQRVRKAKITVSS